jgi:hypothetical protein
VLFLLVIFQVFLLTAIGLDLLLSLSLQIPRLFQSGFHTFIDRKLLLEGESI